MGKSKKRPVSPSRSRVTLTTSSKRPKDETVMDIEEKEQDQVPEAQESAPPSPAVVPGADSIPPVPSQPDTISLAGGNGEVLPVPVTPSPKRQGRSSPNIDRLTSGKAGVQSIDSAGSRRPTRKSVTDQGSSIKLSTRTTRGRQASRDPPLPPEKPQSGSSSNDDSLKLVANATEKPQEVPEPPPAPSILPKVFYYLCFISLAGLVLSGRLALIGEEYSHIFGNDQEGVHVVTVNQACQVFAHYALPENRVKSWLVAACNPFRQNLATPPATGFAEWELSDCNKVKLPKKPNPVARAIQRVAKKVGFKGKGKKDHDSGLVELCLQKQRYMSQQMIHMRSVGLASILLVASTYEAIISTLMGYHDLRYWMALSSFWLVAVLTGVTAQAYTLHTWVLLALALGIVATSTFHKEHSLWPGEWTAHTWGVVVGMTLNIAITVGLSESKPPAGV